MSRLASPFGDPDPHARAAAEALAARVRDDRALWRELSAPNGGKMFGVLLARDREGQTLALHAFSGMLAGAWHVPGFVGPAFDLPARDAFWIEGEASLGRIADELATIDARRTAIDAELAPIAARHATELAAITTIHRDRKRQRRLQRVQLAVEHASGLPHAGPPANTTERAERRPPALSAARTANPSRDLEALANESRRDSAERERLLVAHARERAHLDARRRELDVARAELAARRAARSRTLLLQIQATYRFANARGELRTLRELFAPAEPPGGAGDCAAPKLFAEAYRRGLQPLGLAEIWIGAPPATGGRRDGACYPACRGKCGPILAHVLGGLDTAPAPAFGSAPIDRAEPRTIFEDDWLAVVDKPAGLLSTPGRGAGMRDSVLVRMRQRYPHATGPLIVHRLDLDTSGLLLVAKDEATYKALQAQFARREIEKRYVAWLDGEPSSDGGIVELALRVDLDDRPRQIHDPVHGRTALTQWRVDHRARGRTRVVLVPRTGRTHQLRVHAAHPRGIGVPIVGDRLYGTAADRLELHAEALAFVHPQTGARIALERAAPF